VSEEYYVLYSVSTGQEIVRGFTPPGGLALQRVPDGAAILAITNEDFTSPAEAALPGLRLALWNKVKALRTLAVTGGVDTPIGRVQSDVLSRIAIANNAAAAMGAKAAGEAFSDEWTLDNNQSVLLDADGMIDLNMAVCKHVQAAQARGRDLRAAIDAAQDVATLFKIDVTTGWPSVVEPEQ